MLVILERFLPLSHLLSQFSRSSYLVPQILTPRSTLTSSRTPPLRAPHLHTQPHSLMPGRSKGQGALMADNNQPVPSMGDELVPLPSKKTKYKSKFHTKYRPSIQNNTVCALLTCKINNKVPCQGWIQEFGKGISF